MNHRPTAPRATPFRLRSLALALTLLAVALPTPAPAAEARLRVAVIDFESLGEGPKAARGRMVSEMLTTALAKTGRFELVERKQLENLLGEMEIGQNPNSGLAAEKIGSMVSADATLCGTVSAMPGGLRIDARLIGVKSGRILAADDGLARDSMDSLSMTVAAIARKLALAPGLAGQGSGVGSGPRGLKLTILARRGATGELASIGEGGSLFSGDHYRVLFTPDRDSHVYLFQVDSAGQLFKLHPSREFMGLSINAQNPVKAGETRVLPARDKAYVLDDQAGRERLYLVVRDKPDPRLDELCASLDQAATANNQLQSNSSQLAILQDFKSRGIALVAPDQKTETAWDKTANPLNALGLKLNTLCGDCANVFEFTHKK